ncbi:hypothetical protein D9758_001857 [Tetrapyrgos nigripes]|uniref:BZIP domain-containing protein n=1 Tax=Tetrapyrgos nigripes TaxID=182062 RepID=A0A8H5LV47_9AGAR|nr:hypothetical protein D9758_001857 [Tetrapyrgos nigripes]
MQSQTDPQQLVQPTMRLRDQPPDITQPAPRQSRKRKSPPTTEIQQQQPPPPPQTLQHVLPAAHTFMHPSSAPYPFPPPPNGDYTTGGLPPQSIPQPPPVDSQQQPSSPGGTQGGRVLSNSKRAEQNRKAQRAFRERRDQHVKALESRSQLLDAALASADEANRRWEECRALVDQLRVENAALRAALTQQQSHMLSLPSVAEPPPIIQEDRKPDGGVEIREGEETRD